MRMLWPVFAPGLISGCMLGSCYDYRNDYSEYRRIGSEGWRYADTLAFTPVHADTVCRGSLVVALRHDESYPYDELWLEVMTEIRMAIMAMWPGCAMILSALFWPTGSAAGGVTESVVRSS